MKTYVINLDRAPERWARVADAMTRTGLTFERFAAVDGRRIELPIAEFSQLRYRLCHGKHPNLGQIGCFLSHVAVLQRFLAEGGDHVMVCEDDIDPIPELAAVIRGAMRHQDMWDVLRLSGFHDAHPKPVAAIGHGRDLAVNFTRLCGTGCYVVSRHAAEVLLQRMLPMRVPIDHAIDREWFYGLRALAVDPLPVRQNLPEIASSIPAASREKLPAWQRYWSVFPYRVFNESCRLAMRTKQYVHCCRTIARHERQAAQASDGVADQLSRAA